MRVPPIPANRLARRSFLAGAGAFVLLGACSSGDGESTTLVGGQDSSLDDLLLIQPGFADGLRVATTLAAGTTVRAPFLLFSGAGPAVNGLPELISGELILPDDEIAGVELRRHDDGIATPYFVLSYPDARVGLHKLRASVEGQQAQEVEFVVAPRDQVGLVQVGERLRSVDTPTFDDARGYDPICTRFDPCPFHEVNLADVIDNGRPTALLISTPGYCQTAICGPSVEMLIELGPSFDIDVIHAEVYLEPGQVNQTGGYGQPGPVIGTYAMTFEPSLLVADAAGVVTNRLDFSFDKVEMGEALASASA